MTSPDDPMITIVAGKPTDEEIAAVVAVLTRRARHTVDPDADTTSGWAGYWRRAQHPLRRAPDAWRRSLRS